MVRSGRLVGLACVACLGIAGCLYFATRAPLRFAASHPPYATGEILFDHDDHEDFDCEDCHGTSDEEEARGRLPGMDACLPCHEGEDAASCPACHRIVRKDARPPSHGLGWARLHGRRGERRPDLCRLCHGPEGCDDCHQANRPADHTVLWRGSTHGRAAFRDRRRCAVCHSADTCEACHEEPPADHTLPFRASGHKQAARVRLRGCLVCHPADECASCHETLPVAGRR